MSNVEPDWDAITEAVLRVQYPKLPEELPTLIASLVPVWAERMASLDPTVRQEQLGSYSVTYASSSAALFITAPEELLLQPYRRGPRHGSAVTPGPSAEASAERGEWWI